MQANRNIQPIASESKRSAESITQHHNRAADSRAAGTPAKPRHYTAATSLGSWLASVRMDPHGPVTLPSDAGHAPTFDAAACNGARPVVVQAMAFGGHR